MDVSDEHYLSYAQEAVIDPVFGRELGKVLSRYCIDTAIGASEQLLVELLRSTLVGFAVARRDTAIEAEKQAAGLLAAQHREDATFEGRG